ncbi:EamA family transporter [Patescibacteria group bacterium]|nr:EamA family transporter [Patescibacteria group bacterium]
MPSIMAFLLLGLWLFFSKVATLYMPAKLVIVPDIVGMIIVGIFVLWLWKWDVPMSSPGIFWSVLAGIAGGAGSVFLYIALARGKVSVVTPIIALYPIVAIVLAFLVFKEAITLKEGTGMIFALIAMVLLAS